MENLKILEEIPICVIPTWSFWFLAASTILFLITIIFCGIMEGKKPIWYSKRGVYCIYGISVLVFISICTFFYQVQYKAIPTGEYRYKVQIEQGIDMKDFFKKYKVINENYYEGWFIIEERKDTE